MQDTAVVCSAKESQPLALAVGTGDCATQDVGRESKLGLDKRQKSECASLTHENVEGSDDDELSLSAAHTPARGLCQGAGCQRHDHMDITFPTMKEATEAVAAHFDRFEENVEAETAADNERGHGAAVSMMSTVEQDYEWRLGEVYPLIEERLFFTVHPDDAHTLKVISMNPGAFFFSNDLPERYFSFCQDFGPTNIAMTMVFCRKIHQKWKHPLLQHRPLVFYCVNDPKLLTNSVMMLSAYLLLAHDFTPEEALLPFARIAGMPVEEYCDATWCPPTFTLHFEWYLRGLARAKELGWITSASFDVEDYCRFDNPSLFNANIITPKLVAFIGPEARTPDKEWNLYMHEPCEFVEEFQRRGVSTVVRLNEPGAYDRAVFESAGIEVVDLEFQDCTTPSPAIIKGFLDAVDSAKGIVAVHCLAGLGRTGTLIAIHMMKHYGFSGREAMGLVRLMRPGSVIGPQQQFLVSLDCASWDGNNILMAGGSGGVPVDQAEARKMAAQVARAAKGKH